MPILHFSPNKNSTVGWAYGHPVKHKTSQPPLQLGVRMWLHSGLWDRNRRNKDILQVVPFKDFSCGLPFHFPSAFCLVFRHMIIGARVSLLDHHEWEAHLRLQIDGAWIIDYGSPASALDQLPQHLLKGDILSFVKSKLLTWSSCYKIQTVIFTHSPISKFTSLSESLLTYSASLLWQRMNPYISKGNLCSSAKDPRPSQSLRVLLP